MLARRSARCQAGCSPGGWSAGGAAEAPRAYAWRAAVGLEAATKPLALDRDSLERWLPAGPRPENAVKALRLASS